MVANRHDGDLAGSGSSIRGRWRFRPWRAKATAAAAAGERLYRTIVEQARNPEFYQQWEVPDTPDGRFDMIALHAILVLRRMRDDATAANTAQALFDRMFVDFDESLREMGVGDLRVGKQVKAMAKGSTDESSPMGTPSTARIRQGWPRRCGGTSIAAPFRSTIRSHDWLATCSARRIPWPGQTSPPCSPGRSASCRRRPDRAG